MKTMKIWVLELEVRAKNRLIQYHNLKVPCFTAHDILKLINEIRKLIYEVKFRKKV